MSTEPTHDLVPTVDIAALLAGADATVDERRRIGDSIVAACEEPGVFRVVGHGVDPALRTALDRSAREFFSLDPAEKAQIAMPLAGAAWRGWFPLGAELTSGAPDAKEGIYFGSELPPEDPRVIAGVPLHGPNLFPDRPADLRPLVLAWMDAVVAVGRAVLAGIALGLGLHEDHFDAWCSEPTVLFRIFHYRSGWPQPAGGGPGPSGGTPAWGVGEHTDYGLLTLLAQDDVGGLEVRIGDRWVPVPPLADALVCNLGDMLERLSCGRFVATPHRVTPPHTDRISMPLFLDPGWDVVVEPLPSPTCRDHHTERARWDGEDVHEVDGPYSEYLLSRVQRVFPDLFRQVGADTAPGSERRG